MKWKLLNFIIVQFVRIEMRKCYIRLLLMLIGKGTSRIEISVDFMLIGESVIYDNLITRKMSKYIKPLEEKCFFWEKMEILIVDFSIYDS